MLDDESIRKPRVLRFFRDFFDYDLGGYICKDTAALAKTGLSTWERLITGRCLTRRQVRTV